MNKNNLVLEAVLRNDQTALKCALEDGANPNIPDRGGRTALANAIVDGNVGLVEMLIAAGADLNLPDNQGFSPLHHAAQRWEIGPARALLAKGALIDPKDSFGNTPLFRAVFASRGRAEMIDILLGGGADQTAKNNSGVSPRDLAATISNFDVLSLLPNI